MLRLLAEPNHAPDNGKRATEFPFMSWGMFLKGHESCLGLKECGEGNATSFGCGGEYKLASSSCQHCLPVPQPLLVHSSFQTLHNSHQQPLPWPPQLFVNKPQPKCPSKTSSTWTFSARFSQRCSLSVLTAVDSSSGTTSLPAMTGRSCRACNRA